MLIYWTIGETPFHKEIMAQWTRRGAPSEWSSYNRGVLEWEGGQAHLQATHASQTKLCNCPSTSAEGRKGEGWRGGDERGVKKHAHLAVTKLPMDRWQTHKRRE